MTMMILMIQKAAVVVGKDKEETRTADMRMKTILVQAIIPGEDLVVAPEAVAIMARVAVVVEE